MRHMFEHNLHSGMTFGESHDRFINGVINHGMRAVLRSCAKGPAAIVSSLHSRSRCVEESRCATRPSDKTSHKAGLTKKMHDSRCNPFLL